MNAPEFAGVLKGWRVRHGFTQREAAAAIGVRTDTIRGWETRKGCPRQPALGEMLRRLRMPVDVDLVKRAVKPPPPIEREKLPGCCWRGESAADARGGGVCAAHGGLEDDRPDALDMGEREGDGAAAAGRAETHIALGLPHDQALISNWESGKAFPRKPRLQNLVAALEQPPASGSGTHNWFVARSKEFGEQLRAWRKARGLRQMGACAALGLPPDQGLICRYERGEASPRRERMERLLAIIREVQP